MKLVHSVWRTLLHIPVGWGVYKACKKNPAAGISYAAWFIAYELNEDRHLTDKAYKDLQGAMIGLELAAFLDWRKR